MEALDEDTLSLSLRLPVPRRCPAISFSSAWRPTAFIKSFKPSYIFETIILRLKFD